VLWDRKVEGGFPGMPFLYIRSASLKDLVWGIGPAVDARNGFAFAFRSPSFLWIQEIMIISGLGIDIGISESRLRIGVF
jgi:hypothetical protein